MSTSTDNILVHQQLTDSSGSTWQAERLTVGGRVCRGLNRRLHCHSSRTASTNEVAGCDLTVTEQNRMSEGAHAHA